MYIHSYKLSFLSHWKIWEHYIWCSQNRASRLHLEKVPLYIAIVL